MKKFNIFLIISVIISSIFIIYLKKEFDIVLILKDLSIILTINLINILNKYLKNKINDELNLIYIIFVILAHFLGVICNFYNYFYWFDKFVHFISGIISSICAIIILKNYKINNKYFNIIFILSFSILIATTWEVFEYICSLLFNVDPQKTLLTGVNDTMRDIIVAYLGSILLIITKRIYNL